MGEIKPTEHGFWNSFLPHHTSCTQSHDQEGRKWGLRMKQLVAFQGLSSCFFHMNEWGGSFQECLSSKAQAGSGIFKLDLMSAFPITPNLVLFFFPPVLRQLPCWEMNRLSSFTHTLSSIPFGWRGKGKNETSTFFSFKSCLKQPSQNWKPISSGNYKETLQKADLNTNKICYFTFFLR